MQAVVETTGVGFPEHTYLLDGDKLVAYIKVGESTPFYFKSPIKGFDRRGRKFKTVSDAAFTVTVSPVTTTKQVVGSKGEIYTIDLEAKTCTCSGYTYRGTCKHTKDL